MYPQAIKGTTFTVGEPLSQYQFHVLEGYTRDVMTDLKALQSVRRSHDEMREELQKKDHILAENDALIEQLRQGETADLQKFKEDTSTQLRAQHDKIVQLHSRLQASSHSL